MRCRVDIARIHRDRFLISIRRPGASRSAVSDQRCSALAVCCASVAILGAKQRAPSAREPN
jgi:hypothetical protein